ncbi:MAG TPA: protein translocase subunit SecD [Acidimicrobiia bacterium]|nr:protein translocase subunit SecD [Acidimicrobiia bacterium]
MRRRLIGLALVLLIAWGGLAALLNQGILPKLGLDLQGGTSVVLTAPAGTDQDVLAQAVEIMRRRIEDVGGVAEPDIAISGGNTVLVQLPGVEDEERALDAIGQTGQLSFRPVLAATPGNEGPLVTTTTTTTTAAGGTTTTGQSTTTTEATTTTAASTTTTTLPPNVDPATGLTLVDDPAAATAYLPGTITSVIGEIPAVLTVGPAQLVGSDVADAVPGFNPSNAQWVINLDLTSEGADKFAEMTAAAATQSQGSPQRQIAIVLDGEVIASPAVASDVGAEGITGGRALITFGAATTDEQAAKDTAAILRYGSLPVAFERSQVQKVSATLGSDSLRAGLIAGYIGLALVAILLLAYYRMMGVVAIVGVTVFGALLVSTFAVLSRLQGLTLTLAGVTGVIIALGIAADSYIVYFERIKEEIRSGRNVRSAVDEAFRHAFRTILTADAVSILGAGLLWFLSVGPVKGFALSLGLATLIDIIVARSFTRRAIYLLARTPFGEKGWLSIRRTAQ